MQLPHLLLLCPLAKSFGVLAKIKYLFLPVFRRGNVPLYWTNGWYGWHIGGGGIVGVGISVSHVCLGGNSTWRSALADLEKWVHLSEGQHKCFAPIRRLAPWGSGRGCVSLGDGPCALFCVYLHLHLLLFTWFACTVGLKNLQISV